MRFFFCKEYIFCKNYDLLVLPASWCEVKDMDGAWTYQETCLQSQD